MNLSALIRAYNQAKEILGDQVQVNQAKDPTYAPYCMRCSGLVRMVKREHDVWECEHCGACRDDSIPRVLVELAEGNARMQKVLDEVSWMREHAEADFCDWLAKTELEALPVNLRPMKRIVDALDEYRKGA